MKVDATLTDTVTLTGKIEVDILQYLYELQDEQLIEFIATADKNKQSWPFSLEVLNLLLENTLNLENELESANNGDGELERLYNNLKKLKKAVKKIL